MGKKRIFPACLLLATLLFGCSAPKTGNPPQLQEPVGIVPDTAKAYIGECYNITYYNSKVIPQVQELSFAVDGVITKVHCYPGMEVSEGTVLAELDGAAIQAQIQQLEAQLEQMQIQNGYANALARLDIEMLQSQMKQLQAQGGSAQEIALLGNEIAQKQAALQQEQAMQALELEEKQGQLEQLRTISANCVLRAPCSGTIIFAETLTEGRFAKAYDPVVFLADDSKLHLSGDYIKQGYLNIADRVYAHIGGSQYEILLRPMDQQEYLAALLAGKEMNTEFDILGSETLLSQVEAGDYAVICLVTDYVAEALLVPNGAVWQDSQGAYVYVEENGTRVRKMVKLGNKTDSVTQILEGLTEGDVVYVQ